MSKTRTDPLFFTDPRGKVWVYTYDSRDRLSATDPLNNTIQWTYDDAGNKLTETRPDNGVTTNVYDAMNRLTSMSERGQSLWLTQGRSQCQRQGLTPFFKD